jgi:hypothetical protein
LFLGDTPGLVEEAEEGIYNGGIDIPTMFKAGNIFLPLGTDEPDVVEEGGLSKEAHESVSLIGEFIWCFIPKPEIETEVGELIGDLGTEGDGGGEATTWALVSVIGYEIVLGPVAP